MKIDNEIKNNIKTRFNSIYIMIAIGIILIICAILADPRHENGPKNGFEANGIDGFAFFLPRWGNFIFALLFIFFVMCLNIFICKEIDNCYTKSNNKKIIGLIFCLLIIPQILPNICMLYAVYWGVNYTNISSIIYFAILLCILLLWIPLYFVIKKSNNSNKFNNIFFPITVLLIIFCFNACYYLAIVRGIFTLLAVVFVCFACDGGGYFFGIFFGKHKLAPKISPKKTWEGVIGSFASTWIFMTLIMIGYSFGQHDYQMAGNFIGNQWDQYAGRNISINPTETGWWFLFILLITFMCLLSIVGDLFFSGIKRANKIKDFSALIKGHGGILDRIDSWVFVIGVFYFITIVIAGVSTISSGWENYNRIFNVVYTN